MMVVNTRCDIVTAFGFSNAPSLLALAIHLCASPEIPIYLVLRKRMSSLWTMDCSSAPLLPLDLERQIFEIAALSRPVGIPNLMLVAWRVKEWCAIPEYPCCLKLTLLLRRPLFYHTIAIRRSHAPPVLSEPLDGYPISTAGTILSAIRRDPSTLFHQSVHNLFLPYGVADDMDVTALLAACISVENLWIAEIDDEMLSFASLSPKQLYTNGLPALAPANPFFSQITHLELFAIQEEDTNKFSRLSLIPQLTHLSFNGGDSSPRIPGDWARHSEDIQTQNLLKDIRFMGIHAGADYWSRAETLIAKHRSGEVPVLQFEILEDESQPGPRAIYQPKDQPEGFLRHRFLAYRTLIASKRGALPNLMR
ncbi:hypothetical protein B0H17DRAFT_1134514 [Mycena rosella]|uniref:Uncharacterized protein n=1 Tax=Mycena rosella TaxID=1033263 RepID=A0AAD7DFP8_MYCRO|nr:hypothetical protein B0H17DRAFT_1134514 [Mycena rosella]